MFTKRIPIGQDNFEKVIKGGYYYTDKTLLIKELVEGHDLVNLITRPRRFGKSLNLSMLQCFFECSEEDKGALFSGLDIAREKALCEKHMGQYPVIGLTFMNAKHDTFADALGAMERAIAQEFRRHEKAVQDYPYSRDRIRAILNAENDPIASYNESIAFLSTILFAYYGRPVILLIDEYDVPLEAAYAGGYYPEMLDFVRSLLRSALKSNLALEFAVLTGCLRLAKESVFTGLNNFSAFSLVDQTFSRYFGFSPDEALDMLNFFCLGDKLGEMKEWFDGYRIGGLEIYNPWSVIKQIREYLEGIGQPLPHWANTSSNNIVKLLIEKADLAAKAEIEELLAGKAIKKALNEALTYDEIFNQIENLWTFLFHTGYLTAEGVAIVEGKYHVQLRIPNKEIRHIFENKIIQWFRSSFIAGYGSIYQALMDKNSEALLRLLNTLLFNSISYMDYSENYYHGIMVGLLANPDFILKSNRETGLGRADITAHNMNVAIVMELKVAASKKNLDQACREALAQIDQNRYADEFDQAVIIKVGIAFYKKTCAVEIES